jgi:cytochrome c oxidase assembly protein subunit 11
MKNYRMLGVLVLSVAVMVGVAYAAVPLYSLFCKTTGYGGTTQRVTEAAKQTAERWVTVSFDTNVDQGLPWDFKPEMRSLRVKLGETYTVKFHAHNRSDTSIAGMATFNVQPDKAGGYFSKIQCFCFDEQVLKPGQTAEMAVQFYVDSAMAADKNNDDVQDITLSYTFFRAKNQDQITAQPKTTGNPT